MATGTNGIATWGDINSAFGTNGSPSNKCPIKSEILDTGKVLISSNYLTNQLVKFEDLYEPAVPTLTINTSGYKWFQLGLFSIPPSITIGTPYVLLPPESDYIYTVTFIEGGPLIVNRGGSYSGQTWEVPVGGFFSVYTRNSSNSSWSTAGLFVHQADSYTIYI